MDNVSEALRDSCNVFFYTTGFRLASKDTGSYDDENGMKYIQNMHLYTDWTRNQVLR